MEQTGNNNTPSISQLPKVNVLVSSSLTHIVNSAKEQDYKNIELFLNYRELSATQFFNDTIQSTLSPNIIYVFLDDNNWFYSKDSVSKAVEAIGKFPALYSDVFKIYTQYSILERLQAFSQASILSGQFNFCDTFFVRAEVLSPRPFDERLQHLYFTILFQTLAQRFIVSHTPECLISSKHNYNIQSDIAILNEQRST